MPTASSLMMVSDEMLTAEINDLERHLCNLRSWATIDRQSDDGNAIARYEAQLAPLYSERARRAKNAPTATKSLGPSSARPRTGAPAQEVEGAPIIIIENGIPRLWRPGDRILKKR